MRARGTVPNGVTCSALMDACLKADELDLAFAVLEHMLDIGIEPTEVCGDFFRNVTTQGKTIIKLKGVRDSMVCALLVTATTGGLSDRLHLCSVGRMFTCQPPQKKV